MQVTVKRLVLGERQGGEKHHSIWRNPDTSAIGSGEEGICPEWGWGEWHAHTYKRMGDMDSPGAARGLPGESWGCGRRRWTRMRGTLRVRVRLGIISLSEAPRSPEKLQPGHHQRFSSERPLVDIVEGVKEDQLEAGGQLEAVAAIWAISF